MRRLRPLVSVRFQVLFHSPARGASHLSLTVLVHYRSSAVFSLSFGMVPDDSDRIPRAPPYSGVSMTRCSLPVREYHPLRRDFPDASGSCIRYLLEILQPRKVRKLHGLGSSRFDRHYSGNRSFFLLLRVLRCFSSPRSLQLRW